MGVALRLRQSAVLGGSVITSGGGYAWPADCGALATPRKAGVMMVGLVEQLVPVPAMKPKFAAVVPWMTCMVHAQMRMAPVAGAAMTCVGPDAVMVGVEAGRV